MFDLLLGFRSTVFMFWNATRGLIFPRANPILDALKNPSQILALEYGEIFAFYSLLSPQCLEQCLTTHTH